jgi:hypothetical protein
MARHDRQNRKTTALQEGWVRDCAAPALHFPCVGGRGRRRVTCRTSRVSSGQNLRHESAEIELVSLNTCESRDISPGERQSWLFPGYRSWTIVAQALIAWQNVRPGFSRPPEMSATSRARNRWSAAPLDRINPQGSGRLGYGRHGHLWGPGSGTAAGAAGWGLPTCLASSPPYSNLEAGEAGGISRKLFAIPPAGPDLEFSILVFDYQIHKS